MRATTGHASGHDIRSDEMTQPAAAMHTIMVDEEMFDLLNRTATTHETDANGALHYLLDVPPVPVSAPADDDE
ncbi:hypothetical protein [Actinoplanes sp. NBRC 103695]|uniref:hypothetical protein n=1 Tax=Actinoplanes sp. NBRC 103695 TaxID=3032202 RepID=UPI0024A588C7|nr:hypothetical protein [Actinoplanes sp. NBRC 103695]GLZ01894.1 hypothetical protein Acsp02_91450 [Actinoplanes sp. NBRC 103695]